MMAIRQAGLTLIELMVTITIAAILAMITAPSFVDLIEKRRIDGFASELSGDIQFARTEAISRNVAVSVVATENAGYTITAATPTATTIKTVTNPASITNSAASIQFGSFRGISSSSTDTVFTIGSSKINNQLRVVINTMGRPQICAVTSSWGGYPTCQ